MSKYLINGPAKLSGKVQISGAKNAALKLIPASILADSPSTINNVPDIVDVEKMIQIISCTGAKIAKNGSSVQVDPGTICKTDLNKNYVEKLRGSIVMVGPMLAKFGRVTFSQPGGCLIGARSIEDHLDMFKQLGIKIRSNGQGLILTGKPKPSEVTLSKLSVTATENAIMASVLSGGVTNIYVAAAEPEIIDLSNFLNKMGAKISGAGTHHIKITGVRNLHGTDYSVMPDRIEIGTFLICAIATNSEIEISPVLPQYLSLVLKVLLHTGARFEVINKGKYSLIKTKKHGKLKSINIDTRTYPGFPTDLQSVYSAFATQTIGKTRIFETLFESRFGYIGELKKMGAEISIESPHIIRVNGKTELNSAKIDCSDIRGGAALVLSALIAKGQTEINNIELIERGYEKIDQKLKNLGVNIKLIK